MKCGLLGNGKQAKRLIDAISISGSELIAHESRDLDKILKSNCDAIAITSPDFCHYEHGMKVLESGKHLFLEKPLATKMDHGHQLINLAKKQNLILAVDYHQRWSLSLQAIQKKLLEGVFGEIQCVKLHWSWKAERLNCWRNQENPWWVLSLLGTHCVDHMIWLFEPIFGDIVEFHGRKDNRHYSLKNEDHAALEFKFKNGIIGNIEVDLNQTSPLTLEIHSEQGTFIFDHLVGQGQKISIKGKVTAFDYQNPWHKAFENFKNTVEGKAVFRINPEEALENIKFLSLI